MKTQGNRTFMGTVVFLDLGEAASASPAPDLQQRVRDVVSRTVGHLPATERILLDTGNGAVVCFPGDPEDAVFVAIGIRDSLQQETASFPDLQVRLGVNLGPVKVLEESPGHTQLLGEGMHGAEALLSFAAPSQILASRSFFELVSSLSDEYRELFHHHGARRLPGARDMDLYELAPVGGARAMVDSTWPAGSTPRPPPVAAPAQAPAPVAAAPGAAAAAPPTPSAGWRPEALADLAGALAKAMGPLAPMLVKRSAQQTQDPRTLCDLLADALTDEADRTAFLAFARKWVTAARQSSPPTLAVPVAAIPARAEGRLNPQERAKLEAALAPHVGPIARVLVDRVAHEAPNLDAASHTLANSLPDGEQRRTFLKTLTLVKPAAHNPAPRTAVAPAPRTQAAAPPRTQAAPAQVPAPAAPAARAVAQRAPARPTEGLGGTQPLLGTLYLGEDVLRRAEQTLARAVGPMARTLVRRASKSARNATELYSALAEELPEGPERDGFLASRDQG